MLLRVSSLSVELNMWNPVYAVAPFILLVISVPLAVFAIVTTSLAITLLSFRAMVVYFQLGAALVGAWLSPPSPKATSKQYPSESSSPSRRHHRRTSSASNASQDTPVLGAHSSRLARKSDSLTALIGNSEITRDFEGVGGWRVPGDEDEEALWMGINSRLQLPADGPVRRHKRSLTGGATPSQRWSFTPEALRMSPVLDRARTPNRNVADDDGDYFPQQPVPGTRPVSSSADANKHHKRRKSGSGSSTASGGSASIMMAPVVEFAE